MAEAATKRFLYPSAVALEALARASAAVGEVASAAQPLREFVVIGRFSYSSATLSHFRLVHEINDGTAKAVLTHVNNVVAAGARALGAVASYYTIVAGVARGSGLERRLKMTYSMLERHMSELQRAAGELGRSLASRDRAAVEAAVKKAIRKAIGFSFYVQKAVEEITAAARELGLLGRFKEVPQLGEPLGFSGSEGGQA